MAALNPLTREVVFKIVFYGPGLGGKTTTLEYIHAATKAEHRGKMVSLATPTDRTLYFDYLPIRVPRVRGMGVRLQLFTVPGQVHFGATRKLVLSGVDGVVFVADSQSGRAEANKESLEDLVHNLSEHQRRLEDVPHTFHWNKRDLSDLMSPEDLGKRLNTFGAPSIPTVATRGEGVFEGLERITRLVLRSYEADLPKANEAPGLSGEVGIEDAIRSLAEASKHTAPPPTVQRPVGGERFDMAGPATVERPVPMIDMGSAPPIPLSRVATPPPVAAKVPPPPREPTFKATISAPPGLAKRFSLAEAWPENERESVRQAEALLAEADAGNAVLACDLLMTRILASAAMLAGTSDAPRDPGLVATLLGVGGAKYLAFRARVRVARQKEPVTMRDAIECYALALEARLARDRIKG
jgi:signal recognition particle receptor subunit beta